MVLSNTTPVKKKVLVVQRNAKDAETLAHLIARSGRFEVVGVSDDHSASLRMIGRTRPDVMIADAPTSVEDILSFTDNVRRTDQDLRMLFVSDADSDVIIFEAIKSGVDGFMLRSDSMERIVESLDRMISGDYLLSPGVVNKLMSALRINRNSPLSPRQSEILRLLTRGMTYADVASHLGISKETSKTHIKNIYKRLKVNSRSEAIAAAFRERLV